MAQGHNAFQATILERNPMVQRSLAAILLSLVFAASATAETVVGSAGENPALAVTGRGDLVAVWVGIDDRANSRGVFVRLYDASGKPKGPAFIAHSEIFGDQTYPSVAADQAGSFVVAWQGGKGISGTDNWPGGDGDLTGVFVQRFDAKGRRQGRQIQVNRNNEGYQLYPAVAMDRSGSFLVAWQNCPGATTGCTGPLVQRFSASGVRRGKEREMTAKGGIGSGLFVTSDPEGFSVGWNELTPVSSSLKSEISPAVARFTPSGQPIAPTFRLFDGVLDATGWDLAALASSEVNSVALLQGIRNSIQVFSPDGEPVGPRRIVGKRVPCPLEYECERVLTLAMNASGHFAVLWSVVRIDSSVFPSVPLEELWAQLFDPEGEPLGDRFQVNRDYAGAFAASAVLSDDGVLTVLWQGRKLSGSDFDIVLRRFRLAL
jgi:hypothetical protein